MSTQIPSTKTAVSYSYVVKSDKGGVLGTLQGFNPSVNRALERVREINWSNLEDTVEIVPGRSEITISIDRLETYDKAMMEALGYDSLEELPQITSPITITETITDSLGRTRTISYVDCWIQSWGKTIREGTITVTETVTLWPTKIVALSNNANTSKSAKRTEGSKR